MVDVDKKYVAQILQNARKKQGLKQSELAEMVGISEKHISKIETGKNYPALDNFLKMIEILNLSLDDFGLTIEGQKSKKKDHMHKIINSSNEKQLDFYSDMIDTINRHF